MNTVKNDDFGVLTIDGGVFTNTDGPAVLNWNRSDHQRRYLYCQ